MDKQEEAQMDRAEEIADLEQRIGQIIDEQLARGGMSDAPPTALLDRLDELKRECEPVGVGFV